MQNHNIILLQNAPKQIVRRSTLGNRKGPLETGSEDT